ncbi:WcbI family polysaccharide biosynthesis putative acetyltransferase [Pararhizobium qamdonense]|uniref:WcbI family polysaccharide biosynthesis putative acetyltransferase n=1 Tax=Pararhizobium qamdonense TaxID=3031126 RepID=UPI0023E0DD93|nr:WcbI family polysaccharide biosynthesis putative acetyltransferase [Pararhizobium qamdonense]
MKKGAVYHALGRRYADQSALSARALKVTNPWISTALFTDDPAYAKLNYAAIFDFIIPLSETDETSELIEYLKKHKRLASLKVAIADRSPFDQTLMIDSDTVVIKDISPAFDLLTDFDLLVCNEVEHHIDTSSGWKASGLKDNRIQGYQNAGMIFFNSYNPALTHFMAAWRGLMMNGDEVLQRSDQDALNHMIGSPIEYMRDIRFSSSALKTREYNAFCRYWRELWDAGQWEDVRIVHTFMTDMIASRLLSGALDWKSIIEDSETDNGRYINSFTSGWPTETKKRFATIAGNRNVSMRQFTSYELRKAGKSEAEDKAVLFSMTPDDTGFNLIPALHALKENGRIKTGARITQIGLMTHLPSLPLRNRNSSFAVGNDLEYLADIFVAQVTGLSRSTFLGFKGKACKTIYREYAIDGNMEGAIEPDQDLIIDIDNSVSPPTRIHNAIAAKASLSPDGVYLITNISPDVAGRVGERLKPFFTVNVNGSTIWLTKETVATPVYISAYTPYSTARIALLGNCQSSALASIIYRVKGVKVDILVDINAQGSKPYEDAHWAAAHTDRVDFCFSQPLSETFGDIRSERLREKYGSRFKQYTNLYFTGYHPDLTYFGDRGVRLQSAMGDYNSRIALIGYVRGLSVDDTLALFNNTTYEHLGYFNQFESSKLELIRRDQDNDVRFAEEFFEVAKAHLPLYTVNHPTAHVLAPLAEMIIEACGQKRPSINIDTVKNPLVDGSIWPVYPEVASHLGLDYEGDTIFYPSFYEERHPMELRDFIATTYERYDSFGQSKITEMPGAQDLAKSEV